jgi:hypothetical protein
VVNHESTVDGDIINLRVISSGGMYMDYDKLARICDLMSKDVLSMNLMYDYHDKSGRILER